MLKLFVYKKRIGNLAFLGLFLAIFKTFIVYGQEVVKPDDILKNKKWTNVFQEADEINRELVWLITNKRPAFNKTYFGKILRAKNQYQNIKLKDKSRHACDNYQIKISGANFEVFEYCQKHRSADILAKVEMKNKKQLHIIFYGQNYSDVIGINAAIVAPKVECDLQINDNYAVQVIKCEPFKFSKGEQVVELSYFSYDLSQNPRMKVEGKVLENMLPYSTLSVVVPEVGKITIKETKLRPDPDEFDPSKVKSKPKPKEPQVNGVQPINPAPSVVPVKPNGELASPREEQNVIFTPEGEKIIKQSEPDMIELKPENNNTPTR